MKQSLLRILRCPTTGEQLDAHAFETGAGPGGEDIAEGLLVSRQSRRIYPIQAGIPIMFDRGLPREFANHHRARIAEILGNTATYSTYDEPTWSFSDEWCAETELGVERTWGFTTESRLEQMLVEVDRPREWFAGKTILDAGCGNGRLTDRIANLGAEAVGIDFSSSAMGAHARRRSPSVHYVRGDLQHPPFGPETFDAIISNGVLHHTLNTEHTFRQVAPCVRRDGAFYMWLYSRPENFTRRYLRYGFLGIARRTISRLPQPVARAVCRGIAPVVRAKYQMTGQQDNRTINELVIGLMDSLTPRWQHYHTPVEVAKWYFETGFGAPTVSNWDNPYGFGVVAWRRDGVATPGVRFDEQRERILATHSKNVAS